MALAVGTTLVGQSSLAGRSASEGLIAAIGASLQRQDWRLRDLQALLVVRGPGSFTGVRVGLSAAKALAEASALPLIGVSRLEVLAGKARVDGFAVLQAGRGEAFWARVVEGSSREQGVAPQERVAAAARAQGVPLLCEEGYANEFAAVEIREVPGLTAADAIPLGLARLREERFEDPLLLDALYLHKTEQETLDRQRRHQVERSREVEPR